MIDYFEGLSDEGRSDIWDDVKPVLDRAVAHTGYPTQKPQKLVERMILACTDPEELVLDCFCGSGVTQAAAQVLGRRWIGCDINKGAVQTTAKRLQSVMQQQAEAAADPQQASLDETDQAAPRPAQLSFTTWRVNDYDLQIQHNEAVALACEHIGITRSRTDSFFDGRLGNRLLVTVNDVFSPTIVQRLNIESGVFRASIDDWRAVVDCILIDTDFDGEVFNIARSDIPEKKSDLVEGCYKLTAPPKSSTVAVKIIDMLGEELIVTTEV